MTEQPHRTDTTEQPDEDERAGHGDPLFAAAEGRGDGDEGTRHGRPYSPDGREERPEEA